MESRKQILTQEEDEGNSQGDGERSSRQQLWERTEDIGGKPPRGKWNERLFDILYGRVEEDYRALIVWKDLGIC